MSILHVRGRLELPRGGIWVPIAFDNIMFIIASMGLENRLQHVIRICSGMLAFGVDLKSAIYSSVTNSLFIPIQNMLCG